MVEAALRLNARRWPSGDIRKLKRGTRHGRKRLGITIAPLLKQEPLIVCTQNA
ncbi:MAG: hypothetical protein WBX25_12435 [Rhodomicrobium sp.]